MKPKTPEQLKHEALAAIRALARRLQAVSPIILAGVRPVLEQVQREVEGHK